MAPNPDRELGEARAAVDRGDALVALRRLDRARRGYGKHRDTEGLEHVLGMADLVDTGEDRARIARENLRYATRQNLRQETRRAAQERKESWVDPYPDLQAPTEHTGIHLSRAAKIVIGVAVLLATAILAAAFILPWFFEEESSPEVTLRLVNDTPETVSLRGCDDVDCFASWMHREVEPGLEIDRDLDAETLLVLFKVERSGRDDECLPVRLHDGYEQLGGADEALAVGVSEATECPGTTVLPEPAEGLGL